jgi:uncharacterized membrane protein
MNPTHESTPGDPVALRLAALEARVMQLETQFSRTPALTEPGSAPSAAITSPAAIVPPGPGRTEDDLEFEVGRNWFARVGVIVLTIGAGFTLSLPYASLPAAAPSLTGFALALGLFGLSWHWRHTLGLVSSHLLGVGMALLFFATLRLYFFGEHTVLQTDSFAGQGLLVLVVAANLLIAYRRRSLGLSGLALLMGYVAAIAVGSPGFVLAALLVLSALATLGSLKGPWPSLSMAGILLGFGTYFLWSANNPLLGRPFQFVAEPAVGPAVALACVLILAVGPLLRRNRPEEDGLTNSCALVACALGYGVFLVHTLAAFSSGFVVAHLAASLVLLGLAVLFWVRDRSRVSTFLYAMTGYMALSLAIIKASSMPAVFVWLSLQSVLVVATAIWFRSRFIVVANFFIYAAIVLGYVVLNDHETGISLGFGVVALISARILNWQQSRLELKTELMRNSYLLSAFIVFPYALYHLVPGRFTGLAWVGLALFYYLMNLVVRSQKFRWMGHATLLFTSFYLVIVGTSSFTPVLRVLSFLALGTVMLIVSLIFTRLRQRRRPAKPEPSADAAS